MKINFGFSVIYRLKTVNGDHDDVSENMVEVGDGGG